MGKINIYGFEIDRDNLAETLCEAERNAIRNPHLVFGVELDLEYGVLVATESTDGNNFSRTSIRLYNADRRYWDTWKDYLQGWIDETQYYHFLEDVVKDHLTDEECARVYAVAEEEDRPIYEVMAEMEPDALDAAVRTVYEEEIIDDTFDVSEVIDRIIAEEKRRMEQ